MKKKAGRIYTLLIIFFLALMLSAQNRDDLKYRVRVTARIIPVFATTGNGDPVFDLKPDDVELYVNGRKIKIREFRSYSTRDSAISGEKKKVEAFTDERVVFLVLDSLFNSHFGFMRSREIAGELVKRRKPGDVFVILHSTPGAGLLHVCGPEKNPRRVLQVIAAMRPNFQSFSKGLHSRTLMYSDNRDPLAVDGEEYVYRDMWGGNQKRLQLGDGSPTNFTSKSRDQMKKLLNQRMRLDSLMYKTQTQRFARSLGQLQYALKTITLPKLVYLFSEGVSRAAFLSSWKREETREGNQYLGESSGGVLISTVYLNYLNDVARSINRGGSILYVINPRGQDTGQDRRSSGDMSLKFMSQQSGGMYFSGTDVKTIASSLEKATLAYYDVAFNTDPLWEKPYRVRVRCRRRGVKIRTVRNLEEEIPYEKMEKIQKRVFALNVATGGSWSRIVGRVMRMPQKTLGKKTGQSVTAELRLPEDMAGCVGDIYLIRQNIKENILDFQTTQKTLGAKEVLTVSGSALDNLFAVIIEPKTVRCLYAPLQLATQENSK